MRVEIWSDLICPWCYIGKRQFEAALRDFPAAPSVEIVWRSFELDPQAPTTYPGTLNDLLARKYGASPEQAAEMNARVATAAKAVGLHYDLVHARPGNTFAAHQLCHLGVELGLGHSIMEQLMHGYFTQRLPIGNREALLDAVAAAGMAREQASAALDQATYAAAVRADEERAAALGVRSVPCFVFDGVSAVVGAQPAEALLQALRRAAST